MLEIDVIDPLDFDAVSELPFVAEPASAGRIETDGALDDAQRLEDAQRIEEFDDATAIADADENDDARGDTQAPDVFDVLVALMTHVMLAHGASPDAAHLLRALAGLERMQDCRPGETTCSALIAAGLVVPAVRGLARTPEFASQVRAWKNVLNAESDDLSACGSVPLDEWAATVIATALGDATRVSGIRRELRSHGVAAFGLVARVVAA